MSDAPKIYPFKRGSSASIPQPTYGAKRRLRKVSLSHAGTVVSLSICAFLLARAQILGGLYPFGPAFLGAASLVYPRRGAIYLVPVLLGLLSAMQGAIFFSRREIISTALPLSSAPRLNWEHKISELPPFLGLELIIKTFLLITKYLLK